MEPYKKFEQLIANAQKLTFPTKDKECVRERLAAFIQSMPLLPVSDVTPADHILQRSNFSLLNFGKKLMPIALILTLAVLASTGVSLAAEQALPGDFLYPIKVGVNERVQASLAATPKAKTQLQIRLVTRRIDEAEKLAAKGKLNASVALSLDGSVRAHSKEVEDQAKELNSKGEARAALELSSNLETPLKVHARILEKLSEKSTIDADTKVNEAAGFSLSLKEGGEKAAKVRVQAESVVSATVNAETESKAAAEGSLKAAEKKLEEVRAFVERKGAALSAEAKASIEALVNGAADAIVDGKARMEAKAFNAAFLKFHEAMRLAQEARLMFRAREEHKIDFEGVAEVKGTPALEGTVESETKIKGDTKVRLEDDDGDSEKEKKSGPEKEKSEKLDLEKRFEGEVKSEAKGGAFLNVPAQVSGKAEGEAKGRLKILFGE
ncbi:MAG: DUF5667 domain-containing protein [Patescibacteria group bacterium]